MKFERPNIQQMTGYAAGEQPQDEKTIKLNTNENPYPPSPVVDETIKRFTATSLRRYPPPTAAKFRSIAAKLHQVEENNIIATRGGDELLRLVITTFVDPGETIAMSEPTYSLYPVLAQIHNCPILKVPLEANWALNKDFIKKTNQAQAKLVLVVNPHAPSGHLLEPAEIKQLAELSNSVVLIDEAYVDFIDPARQYDCLSLVKEYNNLIFLRTLSKGYSLAGLRFGYGIGHETLISPIMNKTRDSYNLDLFSQQIATAALSDQNYASQTWHKVREQKQKLDQALITLGIKSAPSEANFLLATLNADLPMTAQQVYVALKQQHILVRYFDAPGLQDKLRITIGTAEENDQLISTIKRLFSSFQ
ncbi:MAG: histidinol-phosphate transaminase [Pseudomonadales bacterium]|nr:histidinol-phosphate transaminase [Pseudomonadales bacterium]